VYTNQIHVAVAVYVAVKHKQTLVYVSNTKERRLSNIKAEHEQGARSMSKSKARGIKYYNTQSRDWIPGTKQGHTRRREQRGGRGIPGGTEMNREKVGAY